mmetsp:Transcript_639/g.1989  ORF Transcript_639/g.1989 Transcript_639/m.1989 type:complete len:228 (+) Transcript_639:2053-2736(+)
MAPPAGAPPTARAPPAVGAMLARSSGKSGGGSSIGGGGGGKETPSCSRGATREPMRFRAPSVPRRAGRTGEPVGLPPPREPDEPSATLTRTRSSFWPLADFARDEGGGPFLTAEPVVVCNFARLSDVLNRPLPLALNSTREPPGECDENDGELLTLICEDTRGVECEEVGVGSGSDAWGSTSAALPGERSGLFSTLLSVSSKDFDELFSESSKTSPISMSVQYKPTQ